MKTIRDLDITGKRVLIRVDFNVPMNEQGEITDDLRIRTILPTIQYALEQEAKLSLLRIWDGPKGNGWRNIPWHRLPNTCPVFSTNLSA